MSAPNAPLAPVPPLTPAQTAGLDDPHLLASCVVEAPAGPLRRIGLGLSGMYCAACAITIEDALKAVPGVTEVQVQAASQRARILLDPAQTRLSDIVAAVQRLGYRAWPDAAARAGHERLRERRALTWRLSVAAFCMMQVMMLAWPQYVAGPDEIPPDIWQLMNWANWVLSLPVMLFSCGPFFRGAWQAARQGRVAMDTPVAIGILATFIVSTAVTMGEHRLFGHEAYFDSLTMFVTFLLAGRWLEGRARDRVTQSLESLCVRLPEAVERAVVQGGGDLRMAEVVSVPVSELRAGDRVRVAVGQAFPGDGQVLLGDTEVDESLLTGESRAVPRCAGQMVVAGSVNLGAPVWIAVERLGPDTRYQQIVSLVHQALTEKPGWLRLADRVAGPFLWAVLGLAALGALAWQWIDPTRSVWVAVSVLIVTCPCALSLAAPSALLSAAGAMAKRGVLVRRLDALEVLSDVDQVFFDKTGTLTEATLKVVGLHTQSGRAALPGQTVPEPSAREGDLRHLWQMATSLAAQSQHPLSRSLVEAAQSRDPGWRPATLDGVREWAGSGIEALDAQGTRWRLGRRNWLQADAAPGAEGAGAQAQARNAQGWWSSLQAPRVWLAALDAQGQPIAAMVMGIELDEVLRPEAPAALAALRAQGLATSILSGDQPDRVHAAAQQLSQSQPSVAGSGSALRVAGAAVSPGEKLAIVSRTQHQGHRVAVVGDGINDAPVLAKADVSIALDQGAALAQSQADLIVLNGRLGGLPDALALTQRTRRVVRQNLAWAAVYNFSCIPLALAGLLPPWAAGLGMAISSLAVVLNSLRLGSHRPAGPAPVSWKSSTS